MIRRVDCIMLSIERESEERASEKRVFHGQSSSVQVGSLRRLPLFDLEVLLGLRRPLPSCLHSVDQSSPLLQSSEQRKMGEKRSLPFHPPHPSTARHHRTLLLSYRFRTASV
mmetsp:Transcript_10351/g.31865  ORF Transcript_10351/g.31865 Transcript_10351/m.31865 type:complete len:112 (-) Transcript_10351:1675-2010(-)